MRVKITDNRITWDMVKPATRGSAGIDLYACIDKPITIYPGEQVMIDSGIRIALDVGWVGKIYPRSSTGNKGLVLANSTGIIDSDYRGKIKVSLLNRNTNAHIITINPMDRIAQLVVAPHFNYDEMVQNSELDKTDRGEGGFGSTGD